ncbi:MAG: putative O-antigen/lipopolysaccharide transport integral membrane protein ABC transporter RfbD [Alphaproteobacteria bacterium]|nr:MAG: putative O-antigen/lipopolysaccharide transport integral membrane protein ABC transporter RfbD [Alphaproteobacteria bacterium]
MLAIWSEMGISPERQEAARGSGALRGARGTVMTAIAGLRSTYSGIAQLRGAVELGWYDFITGYRRSLIGPFWVTIQFSAWILSLTLILHAQLGDSLGSYALYVAVGMMVWEPLSGAMAEGPRHFSQHAQLIQNVPIQLSHLSVRKLTFLVFRASMTAPVLLLLIVIFGGEVAINLPLLALAAVLILMTMYAFIVLFGFIGTFNHDFGFFVPAVTRFLFFVTPIIWQANEGIRKTISYFNPFSYYLEIVRGSLLGLPMSVTSWIVVASISLTGLIAAFIVQSVFRRSVIFWI